MAANAIPFFLPTGNETRENVAAAHVMPLPLRKIRERRELPYYSLASSVMGYYEHLYFLEYTRLEFWIMNSAYRKVPCSLQRKVSKDEADYWIRQIFQHWKLMPMDAYKII